MKDCNGNPLPVFVEGIVTYCTEVPGAPENTIYLLKLAVHSHWGDVPQEPLPGQFYMLRAKKSGVLLTRPISVFNAVEASDIDPLKLEFMILEKGQGTKELCHLRSGDTVELIGPVGNIFPKPESGKRVCIVGGGIGVAPVAGFAKTLEDKSYDFYACYKSGSYGIENIFPKKLVISTDDGSVGKRGMVSAVLDAEILKNNYDVVYACGPTPMLAYIQKICKEAGVKSWLSMENRMACGVGACLGCTLPTTEGNKRCCKDGPVFDGNILDFDRIKESSNKVAQALEKDASRSEKFTLETTVAGVKFDNPVIAASGTFGYGSEYASIFDVNVLGGICSKGLTLEGKPGNEGQRLVETKGGLINSIGLENPGIQHFIDNELPSMLKLHPVAIANLSGSSLETYVKGAELLDKTDVPMIELNISCPNVKAGGMAFGLDPEAAKEVVSAVRKATKKPLMVKLSPNAPYLNDVAFAVIEAGADAISLVNTFQAISIDIEKGTPVFKNIRAGFSGPAVKPVALRMCYDLNLALKNAKKNIPVVGLGGISCWQDAVEFIMAGCSAVEVGTATFSNPFCMAEIISGLQSYMERKGFNSIEDFRGCAL